MTVDFDIDDPDEFGREIEALRDRLLRFVTLTGVSDPESLLQSTVETAWRDRNRFAQASRFSTWLFGIARNLARNDRRKMRAELDEHGALDSATTARGVLTSVARRELAARLEIAIGRLPHAFGEAFVLHQVEGLPFKEIATIAGVTEATARVRAFRARALLREELGDLVDQDLRDPNVDEPSPSDTRRD